MSDHYQRIGGEAGIKALVERFYELMDTLPEAEQIRQMHPQDLSGSKEKLFMFLSGWTGGPQLFLEKHGPPKLRARHLPFPIDSAARDQWLMCMRRAMADTGVEPALQEELDKAFTRTADFMRNQNDN